MVFSSPTFLFYFFPLFLLLYYVLPWKNGVLLVASLLFYAWGEPGFVPLLMLSALLNYSMGYAIARWRARGVPLLWLGIAANLAFLIYYKYMAFLCQIARDLLAPFGRQVEIPEIVLPLGISFFTFQGISYLIDVYRNEVNAQQSFWRFAMYKAMFPQLIAGPIVRYKQIAHEVDQRSITNARVVAGFHQFAVGLAQKVLIANTVALPADRLFLVPPGDLSMLGAWIGIACYSIQILYDFAGYSNMAIGIGHMIGFSYPPNFNRPYSSASVTEFWRRWHMSLSSWFRDYLYIPLGGNRVSPLRTYINLAVVFLLCGLWHGAAWTFIIWGGWHGLLLIVERAGLGNALARLPRLVSQAYTLFVVMIGWVFFRANDVPHALHFLKVMFGQGTKGETYPWQSDFQFTAMTALAVGAVLAVWPASNEAERLKTEGINRAAAPGKAGITAISVMTAAGTASVKHALAAAAIILCAASLAAGTYNPFIYFRF
ncbi:MBOAT family O-acyltransferase [Noviherbaspirillum aerium]|uniref:MBOAT family O-acyltransferase n=1 Tax=Noviherbaspirillum aerium TaxID=2588497 RepID=UPI00124D94E3|nr:MBOAT family protein [Noviherbaspirillum aerium]